MLGGGAGSGEPGGREMTLLETLEKFDAGRTVIAGAVDELMMLLDAEQTRRQEAERAAAKAGAEAGTLRIENERLKARVAELEAALDVEPCADCGGSCGECKDEKPAPYHCDRCGADFDAPVDHGDGWDRCPECGTN